MTWIDGLAVLVFAAALFINLYILYWLVRLERIGCQCAMDWRRYYIIAFMILNILFALFGMKRSDVMGNVIYGVWLVLVVLNIVFVLQYVHRLKKEKCECSAGLARDVMYVIAIINTALIFLSLIASLVIIMLATRVQKAVSKR